jgi:hypothetical protein
MIMPHTPPPHFNDHRQTKSNEYLALDKWQADTTGRGSTDRLWYRESYGSNGSSASCISQGQPRISVIESGAMV